MGIFFKKITIYEKKNLIGLEWHEGDYDNRLFIFGQTIPLKEAVYCCHINGKYH